MPSGGLTSTLSPATSFQFVLNTVPPDSIWKNKKVYSQALEITNTSNPAKYNTNQYLQKLSNPVAGEKMV